MQLSNYFRILVGQQASYSIHYRALEIDKRRPFFNTPSQRARVLMLCTCEKSSSWWRAISGFLELFEAVLLAHPR